MNGYRIIMCIIVKKKILGLGFDCISYGVWDDIFHIQEKCDIALP